MNWKKLGATLLFPPPWALLILTAASAASLILVFANGWDARWFSYALYVLAFYTLTALCIFARRTLPGYYKAAKAKVYANQYANRYLTDAEYKTHVNLYRSLVINLLYAGVNAAYAVLYRTRWFALFAGYYAVLAVMRFLLARYVTGHKLGSDRPGELRRTRLCACILLTVNLSLSGAVLMMVYFHRGFEDHGLLIYVMALYTFYTAVTAIMAMVRSRRFQSPILSMSAVIKLAAALVSMLSLEAAMFAQFGGDMATEHQRVMLLATGAGFAAVIAATSVLLIVGTTKEIRRLTQYGT